MAILCNYSLDFHCWSNNAISLALELRDGDFHSGETTAPSGPLMGVSRRLEAFAEVSGLTVQDMWLSHRAPNRKTFPYPSFRIRRNISGASGRYSPVPGACLNTVWCSGPPETRMQAATDPLGDSSHKSSSFQTQNDFLASVDQERNF